MDEFVEMFAEHVRVMKDAAQALPEALDRVARDLHSCLNRGGKLLACGNGGSAADAEHLVAELVGRFKGERRALPAIALAGGVGTLTAIANDYGYERVFARQVEAFGARGDLLLAISTSGNSPNVLAAVEAARARGVITVALTGASGGTVAGVADFAIRAPSAVTARIQEVHGFCIHAIVESLDRRLAEENIL
jgi:phosphoheptose isomerase